MTITTTKQLLWRLTRVEEDYRTMNSYKDLQDVQSYCSVTDIVQCSTLISLDIRHWASEFNNSQATGPRKIKVVRNIIRQKSVYSQSMRGSKLS